MSTNVLSHLPALTQLVIATNGIKGCSFCSLEYTNEAGEEQKTLINIGVSYANAKLKDIEFLEAMTIGQMAEISEKRELPIGLVAEAVMELLKSLKNPNEARSKGQIDAYTHINNGMKYHNETGELYVYGMKVKKVVTKEGEYKEVKSKPLTIAKDAVRGLMKSTQYRQYKIKMTAKASLKGDTLTFAD